MRNESETADLVSRPAFRGNPDSKCACKDVTHCNFNSDQLARVFAIVGSPSDEAINSKSCEMHIRGWPKAPRTLERKIRQAFTRSTACTQSQIENVVAVWSEVLAALLQLEPRERWTCKQAFDLLTAESGTKTCAENAAPAKPAIPQKHVVGDYPHRGDSPHAKTRQLGVGLFSNQIQDDVNFSEASSVPSDVSDERTLTIFTVIRNKYAEGSGPSDSFQRRKALGGQKHSQSLTDVKALSRNLLPVLERQSSDPLKASGRSAAAAQPFTSTIGPRSAFSCADSRLEVFVCLC